jgi:hypothetical protein
MPNDVHFMPISSRSRSKKLRPPRTCWFPWISETRAGEYRHLSKILSKSSTSYMLCGGCEWKVAFVVE